MGVERGKLMLHLLGYTFAMGRELPERHIAGLDEADHVRTVQAGDDRAAIWVEDGGDLVAYAVLGRDAGGALMIFAARAIEAGVGREALRGLLGTAEIMGQPLRVHADAAAAMARLAGGKLKKRFPDPDGILQAVIGGRDGQQK